MDKEVKVSFAAPRRPSFPTIPGYRFIQPIAASPHSAVYLAYSNELGHEVAVKVLRSQQGMTPEKIRRFEREREALMRIRHRSVVDIYDWGDAQGAHFIATEYFPAGSLDLRIRNLMTVKDSIDAFVQIGGALLAVHRVGLCHRDLKPANVMLRKDGSIVLIDFGLATMVEDTQLTDAGEVHGSPYYISPEQVDGSSSGDNRSDLYSLGVMFYEMLTGTRPFQGKTVFEIIHAHKNAPPPELPGELLKFQGLVHGLMTKDPNLRIQSAAEALNQLAKLPV